MEGSSKTLTERKRLSSSTPEDLISRSSSAAAFTTLEIGEELIREIFLRLPVKLLFRLRCLSKSCRSLIDSSDFVAAYSSGSVPDNNPPCAVIAHSNPLRTLSLDLSIDESDPEFNTAKATSELIPPLEINRGKMRSFLVACCRGILCYSFVYCDQTRRHFFILWNPSTRYYRKIECPRVPRNPNINVKDTDNPNITFEHIDKYGCYFGYDHVNDDYKLLRSIHGGDKKLEFKVYSFKMLSPSSSSSSWRKIKCAFPFSSWQRLGPGVFVDGTSAIHFLVHPIDSDHLDFRIAAFDLATENFSFVPLPVATPHLNLVRSLGCLDGYLYFIERNYNCVNVWMMEDYGIQNSWIKLMTREKHADIKSRISYLLVFSKSGRKVLVDMIGNLHWYDLENQELQNGGPVELSGIPDELQNGGPFELSGIPGYLQNGNPFKFSGVPGLGWKVHICSASVARPYS